VKERAKAGLASSSVSVSLPMAKLAELIVPWLLFMALLLWGWRVKNLFHAIPSYGDVLEVLWGIEWYGDRIPGESPLFYPLIFHPQGWQVATFAHTPVTLIALAPLYKFGGSVFAYNIAVLLSFFVAFAGMYRLARELAASPLSATVAALMFTFWGFRWLRIHGHLNILLASSLLPWMGWTLERAFRAPRRAMVWFTLAGVAWALTIANALPLVWIGGIMLLGWITGRCLGGPISWRIALSGLIGSSLTAALLSAPVLILFLQARAAAGASFYDINHVNHWGASLNSLPIPFVAHPWLQPIAQWIYHGPWDESGVANLGLLASAVALVGLQGTWRDKNWRPILITTLLGLLLALGFTLKWNGETVQCYVLRPLNSLIWQIGHRLKPGFFTSSDPTSPLNEAVPMPGLVLAATVPFWEAARVLSRYVLAAGVGFFILVSQGVERVRYPTARMMLAAALIVEIIPPPVESFPSPPTSHAAFGWLKEQSLPNESVVDLFAPQPHVLALRIQGETLWATRYHDRATVAGAGSIWPAHTWFLFNWFAGHPHPFQNPDFIPLLRYYQADFILLHMQGGNEWGVLEEAQSNTEVELIQCFDPPPGPSPWPYPICVVRILPPSNPHFNVLFREGWSGEEPWGIWADGVESRARWVATSQTDHRFSWEAFPHCVPGEKQSLSLKVNDVPLMTHQWEDCEPWQGEVVIPASLIQIGWNDMRFHYAYAARPVDITDGENPDPRDLSVGFARLEIEER
jgi:hypothetical protein